MNSNRYQVEEDELFRWPISMGYDGVGCDAPKVPGRRLCAWETSGRWNSLRELRDVLLAHIVERHSGDDGDFWRPSGEADMAS